MMPNKGQSNYISLLPSAVTLMNGLCGFVAIIMAGASPLLKWNLPILKYVSITYVTTAAWLVLIAMVFDALDGRVARASGYTSEFGAQLDSLCDVISFGVAPAVIAYRIFSVELDSVAFANARMTAFVVRLVMIICVFYVLCAIVRLARFNVETEEEEESHMGFSGLPSPGAAGLIVSLVLFYKVFIPRIDRMLPFIDNIPPVINEIFLWVLPIIVLFAGILMISRVPYAHPVNQLLRNTHSYLALSLAIVIFLFAIWNVFIVLLLGFAVFVLLGPLMAAGRGIKGLFRRQDDDAR